MKVIQMQRPGGPDVLALAEKPLPAPAAGEVRVRAEAIGVSSADMLVRKGTYHWMPPLPAVPGNEMAGVVDALARVLRSHRAEERVIVASSEHELLSAFRAVSSVATSFSKEEVRDFLLRLRDGSMEGYRPPGVAFQVPEYKGLRRVVSKSVIEAVHAYSVEVHVWTVNEPVHIARLLSWGVDGIMTDDPARLHIIVQHWGQPGYCPELGSTTTELSGGAAGALPRPLPVQENRGESGAELTSQ